jgi:hypothetical protein
MFFGHHWCTFGVLCFILLTSLSVFLFCLIIKKCFGDLRPHPPAPVPENSRQLPSVLPVFTFFNENVSLQLLDM